MNITYKNYPSKYELQYVKWNGINFDRERLIKFMNRLRLTYFFSFIPHYRKEHQILTEILNTYDKVRIDGMLSGDENILRMCFIEKWARIAAVDILLTNTYSRLTYTTISNLPIKDFQLLSKRVEEMVEAGRNITFQSDNITDNIPGL
jgi:hypothetical protein